MSRNTDTLRRAIRAIVPDMHEDDHTEALYYTTTDADGEDWDVYLTPYHHDPEGITLQCVRVEDTECSPVVVIDSGSHASRMTDDAVALAVFLRRLPYARAIAAAIIDTHRSNA